MHVSPYMFPDLKVLPHKDRLLRLGLCGVVSQGTRRKFATGQTCLKSSRWSMVFQLFPGLSSLLSHIATNITRASWSVGNYRIIKANLIFDSFFSQRCINRWNILSEETSLAIAKTTARCAQYMRPEKFRESSQTPPATFPEICKGLLFRSILRMCTQNLKFVVLSVPEIIGVLKKFGQSLDTPTLHFLSNF